MKKNFQQLQAEILHLEDRRYYFNWNPYILGEDENWSQRDKSKWRSQNRGRKQQAINDFLEKLLSKIEI